jgi:hypothetical protein
MMERIVKWEIFLMLGNYMRSSLCIWAIVILWCLCSYKNNLMNSKCCYYSFWGHLALLDVSIVISLLSSYIFVNHYLSLYLLIATFFWIRLRFIFCYTRSLDSFLLNIFNLGCLYGVVVAVDNYMIDSCYKLSS